MRICRARAVEMHFSGLGSMMHPHFRRGPCERPYTPTAREDALRELYFFDLLAQGIYIARRGMIAMSLPIGAAECESLLGRVENFCTLRAPYLTGS
jgi:glutamate-1-semialdehyde 2,1-aminomutase